ncbi:hypothetical protein BDQ17DRAFT_471830 [Cyathus striatus]|nr:hypothetical protein BDQ17DRAFT_471830 [Cyathus striatus]
MAAISQTADVCSYEYVQVTDYYRRDEPYLLFPFNGHSRCIVQFRVHDLEDHILTLRHCVTTSKGKVDITLNGTKLDPTWGIAYPVMANFQNEDIMLPCASLKVAPEQNELEIKVTEDSEGVYWLSDVFLPARKASSPKPEEDEPVDATSEN